MNARVLIPFACTAAACVGGPAEVDPHAGDAGGAGLGDLRPTEPVRGSVAPRGDAGGRPGAPSGGDGAPAGPVPPGSWSFAVAAAPDPAPPPVGHGSRAAWLPIEPEGPDGVDDGLFGPDASDAAPDATPDGTGGPDAGAGAPDAPDAESAPDAADAGAPDALDAESAPDAAGPVAPDPPSAECVAFCTAVAVCTGGQPDAECWETCAVVQAEAGTTVLVAWSDCFVAGGCEDHDDLAVECAALLAPPDRAQTCAVLADHMEACKFSHGDLDRAIWQCLLVAAGPGDFAAVEACAADDPSNWSMTWPNPPPISLGCGILESCIGWSLGLVNEPGWGSWD